MRVALYARVSTQEQAQVIGGNPADIIDITHELTEPVDTTFRVDNRLRAEVF